LMNLNLVHMVTAKSESMHVLFTFFFVSTILRQTCRKTFKSACDQSYEIPTDAAVH
jgi:hypothetical protein